MNLKKLESCLRVNLLEPGPRLIKKNLPGRSLTKVEKHCTIDFEHKILAKSYQCLTFFESGEDLFLDKDLFL